MRHVLTSTYLENLKPPANGRLDIADLRCAGLSFRITSAGSRSFNFRFRDPGTGKTTRATIGAFPTVTLGKARARAEALRKQVVHGVNPVMAKRQARAEADSKTFMALAERYLEEHSRRHKRSADADERNLRLHVLPLWGDRPYESIGRRDIIELAEKLVTAGKPTLANRVQALVSSIFAFAIDADLVQANPASRLRKRGVETRKTRVLSDDEIRLLWGRAVLPPISRQTGLALRLCLLTGLRAGEAAGLRRDEAEHLDDPGRAALMIRGERTKNSRAHFVPLAPLAVATLREAIELAGDDDRIFGVEGHALAVAMRRLVDRLPDEPDADAWRADPPTPHDLRRSCATRLAGLGVPGEDVSAILNHVRQDVTGRHYDRYTRSREKRIALSAWSAELTRIINPDQAGGGAIVPLRRGRP